VFRYLLRLPDGEPPDPAMLVTAVPTWAVGDVMTVERGKQFRVIAIDDFPHAEFDWITVAQIAEEVCSSG
jgi:hypothetical protein